jgi:hypothetical protein
MGNLLYILAFLLLIVWAICFLGFNAGGQIHILLGAVIVVALIQSIPQKSVA